MNISVVIPNYNGENLLKKNLPKIIEELQNYKDGDVEVIVVDDASTDSSESVISNFIHSASSGQISSFKFIKNKRNLGFSSTVNKGASIARGDILLLLNTDVYSEKGLLTPLLKHFKDEDVFAVGCMDKSIEGNRVVLRGRGLGSWQRGLLIHRRGDVGKKNTLWVSGGSGAFRRSIWEKLGGLNELYDPFYWEDIDLSYRAQKSGYKVLFEPESIVFHEHSRGAIKKTYTPFKVKTIAYRNQFIFVWSNATDIDIRLEHLIFLPYHIAKALLRLDMAFFIGLFSAFILLPKVIEFNSRSKKMFVKKDREVVASVQE
ncbi:MAG: glycosyltransferase family 2 protein [Candidatus Levyibacteriota bacterium]